ncbi:unnamed protein product [Polarella glacialis]|uniref:Pentatricopeptide repeat-containing protein-mitochondrial domain-containing protein n=1 Tax=Polarella glacialis TaxID=89957 RepID=A0A813G4X4_POLGL|nr:unnamed protein product [Polarella glacialis]
MGLARPLLQGVSFHPHAEQKPSVLCSGHRSLPSCTSRSNHDRIKPSVVAPGPGTSFEGSRALDTARRAASCRDRDPDRTSSGPGRPPPQDSVSNNHNNNNKVLQQLLALGKTPTQNEVSEVLLAELPVWTRNSRRVTVVLSSLAKHRLPQLARQVLTFMLESHVESDVIHYNVAISAYGNKAEWQMSLSLLWDMSGLKLTPNVRSYSAAISACEKGGRWQLALNVLAHMRELMVMPNEITYNAAISACEKAGQWQLALGLVAYMREVRVSPNDVTYNAAISACEKASQWQLALSLLSCMPLLMVMPDTISYNAAMSACEKGGQWQLAMRLLNTMPGRSAMPNRISYSAAMSACSKGSQWQLVLSLLSSMPDTRVIPDEINVNAAIDACAREGKWQLALSLLSNMPLMMAMPDVMCYSAAISACEKARKWQEALSLLSIMPSVGVMPNRISYSAAISACEKAAQWQLALCILNSMRAMKVTLDIINCNAAISACEKGGRWQMALSLLTTMFATRMIPNKISYNAVISACGQGHQWQLAFDVLKEMLERQVVPDEWSYTALLSACEGSHQLEQGLQLLLELREGGGVSFSASFFPWALASLSVSDPEIIRSVFDEVLLTLSTSELPPQQLSIIAWASGMLGVKNAPLFRLLLTQALPRMKLFAMDELLKLAWGFAASRSDLHLLGAIQEEVTARLEEMDLQSLSESTRYAFVQDTLVMLWAFNFAGLLGSKLLTGARQLIRQAGAIIDRSHGLRISCAGPELLATMPPVDPAGSDPRILLSLPDRLVIFKPPGWEVHDQQTELQLSSFLQASLGAVPITRDVLHQCGFLHRLDVPSSGLVFWQPRPTRLTTT